MKVKLAQDVVHEIGPFPTFVYPVEGIAGSLDRQCRYVDSLTIGRNGGDTGSDAKANVSELTQLLHHSIDCPGIRPLRIKDGLGIIEYYEDLLG